VFFCREKRDFSELDRAKLRARPRVRDQKRCLFPLAGALHSRTGLRTNSRALRGAPRPVYRGWRLSCHPRAVTRDTPQKSFEASSGTGRSPPAFEEWLAAKPQDILSEQCERSNCKLFANDILLPTGEGVWGAEYRSPKVGAPAPGRAMPARGGFAWGSGAPPCAAVHPAAGRHR